MVRHQVLLTATVPQSHSISGICGVPGLNSQVNTLEIQGGGASIFAREGNEHSTLFHYWSFFRANDQVLASTLIRMH